VAETIRGSVLTLGDRAKTTAGAVVGRVLVQGISRILENARGPWPVDTGASRASLGFVFNGKQIWIEAIYYAPLIYSHGVHPWDLYIAQPTAKFVRFDAPNQIGAGLIRALVEGNRA
jgi:hypothetical protein